MQLSATYKGIWLIAYPIIIGSLAQNLISLTDVVFLGRVGQVAQGASGLISIYYLVMVMVGMGLSRGAQIIIARRAGANQKEAIGLITDNLLYLQVIVAFILYIFLELFSPLLIGLFVQDQAIYDACLGYLEYRSFGIFFSGFAFVLMALYTGIGRTRVIAYVTVILFLTNVALNYSLIFGKFGLPEMGIAGAGLASSIAEVVSAIAGLIYVLLDKEVQQYKVFKLKKSRWDWQIINGILSISAPMVVQYIIGMGGWFVFFSLIEKMGPMALAVSTVLKMVYTLCSIPAWGFASAANSIVSNIIGQKKHQQVFTAINKTSVLSFGLTIVPVVILIIFPEWILGLFTNDPAVIVGSQSILLVMIAIIMICSISNVVFNGLMGTGAMLVSLLTEAFSMVVYLGYAYYIVKVVGLGLEFVWGSEFLYWFVLVIFATWYLRSKRWVNLSV